MTFRARLIQAVLATIAIHVLAQQANAGFCSHYEQTWSNAGQCSHCQLSIADNPEIQKYFVQASNGWQAELTFVEGDSSVASGSGSWRNGLPHVYSGKDFEIDMTQQGQSLSMVMSTMVHGKRQIIQAKFRCTG